MHISVMEYEDNSEDEDEDEDDEDEDDGQGQDVDAARSRTESNMPPPPLARSFTANNAISRSSPDNTKANIPTDEMVPPIPPPKPRPLLPADPDLSPIASRKPLPSISATSATSFPLSRCLPLFLRLLWQSYPCDSRSQIDTLSPL
ncbi:hypothetical protein CF326_g8504 [Tilletia indica]|nr:hypothetical protein CF326_g8504 [Tilletia indica]